MGQTTGALRPFFLRWNFLGLGTRSNMGFRSTRFDQNSREVTPTGGANERKLAVPVAEHTEQAVSGSARAARFVPGARPRSRRDGRLDGNMAAVIDRGSLGKWPPPPASVRPGRNAAFVLTGATLGIESGNRTQLCSLCLCKYYTGNISFFLFSFFV